MPSLMLTTFPITLANKLCCQPARLSNRSSVYPLREPLYYLQSDDLCVFSAGFFAMEPLERTGRESGKTVQDPSTWLHGQRNSSENGCLWGSKKWSHSLHIALWSKIKYIWNKFRPAGNLPVYLFPTRLNFNLYFTFTVWLETSGSYRHNRIKMG